MRQRIHGKEKMYNGHPNTIPTIIKQNTKCCKSSFTARSEQEVEDIIKAGTKIFKLFKSFIISKDFFISKSIIAIENFFIILISDIFKQFEDESNFYPIPINSQSILDFKFQDRIILS